MNGTPTIAWTVPMLIIASVAIVTIVAWIIKPLKHAFILHPYSVKRNFHVHRLLTAGWLHADVSHLVFNMFTFYFFANEAMRVLGPARFLILYMTAVVVGFIPTTLRHMNNPKYASLGASGAVAAVMFSAILIHPGLKLSLMMLPIAIPGMIYALAYLAYSAWHSWRAKDGINHDAHFSGAIYGSLITYAFEPARVEATLRNLF